MSCERITANLPSRELDETERFHHGLGLATGDTGAERMIPTLRDVQAEFVPHPDLAPGSSRFSAGLCSPDTDAVHDARSRAGRPTEDDAILRLAAPFILKGAPRKFATGDPGGSLWRVIETGDGT